MKEKWERPELIILMRGRPEEAVLVFCKNSTSTADFSPSNVGCYEFDCSTSCQDTAGS